MPRILHDLSCLSTLSCVISQAMRYWVARRIFFEYQLQRVEGWEVENVGFREGSMGVEGLGLGVGSRVEVLDLS